MGLTEKEAAERLKTEGENVFGESRKTGPMKIFLGQFKDIMVMILLAATVVSVLLGEISDAVTIILIVLLSLSVWISEWHSALFSMKITTSTPIIRN